MTTDFHARVVVTAVCCAAGLLPACRSYEAAPLTPETHWEAWQGRTPSDATVRAFVERLASAGDADASAFDATDGLALHEGELVALVFNPDLRIARQRAGVAAATAGHAGDWDDPEFAIDVLRITESVSSPWVVTPGLALTIPVSGRLEAEKARADAALHAALDRVAEEEWRVRRDVRIAWAEWSAALMSLEQLERLVGSTASLASSASRLADAGEMAPTQAALFSLERARLEYETVRIRGRAAEAEHRLRAVLGLAPGAPVELQPALSNEPWASDALDIDLIDRNPTLVRLRQEYEVAEQTLRREVRKQYPDLTIGPLYETDQGQSRVGFLGAIPIPILNANRQGIAEAEAERSLARAAFETEHERIAGAAAAAAARVEALGLQRAAIVSGMAPLVDRQVADARRLLDLGESGGLVLLESLGRAHDTKLNLIEVLKDSAKARAELAFLQGPAPFPTSGPDESAPDGPAEVNP